MNTELHFLPGAKFAQIETDALVVVLGKNAPPWSGEAGAAVKELYDSGEFTGKTLEIATLHHPADHAAKRLVLIGRGEGKLGSPLDLWRLAGAVTRQLKAKNLRRLAFAVPTELETEAAITAILTGVASGNFDPDTYKSDRQPERQISQLSLLLPESADRSAAEAAVRSAAIIADGHQFARELANEPGNRLTPTQMGERAQAMARAAGLECEIIGAERARELKMGAFLSVAQGSAEPPVMIVLRYRGAPGSKDVLGLIGKGITFDSGGISIKPAANMELMKP